VFGSTLRFIHSKGEQFSPLALWPHRLRFALFSSVKEEMVSCLFQLSGLAINRYWFLFRFGPIDPLILQRAKPLTNTYRGIVPTLAREIKALLNVKKGSGKEDRNGAPRKDCR
jgi:hypothetical protein